MEENFAGARKEEHSGTNRKWISSGLFFFFFRFAVARRKKSIYQFISRLAVTRQPSSGPSRWHESFRRLLQLRPYVANAPLVLISPRTHVHRATSTQVSDLSGSNPPSLPLPTASSFSPLGRDLRKGYGRRRKKVFLRRNTYLRASIFSSCTWNTRGSIL